MYSANLGTHVCYLLFLIHPSSSKPCLFLLDSLFMYTPEDLLLPALVCPARLHITHLLAMSLHCCVCHLGFPCWCTVIPTPYALTSCLIRISFLRCLLIKLDLEIPLQSSFLLLGPRIPEGISTFLWKKFQASSSFKPRSFICPLPNTSVLRFYFSWSHVQSFCTPVNIHLSFYTFSYCVSSDLEFLPIANAKLLSSLCPWQDKHWYPDNLPFSKEKFYLL